MRYKLINQILVICKTNVGIALKKIIMSNFYQHIIKIYSILLITKRPYKLKLLYVTKN